MGHSLPVLGVPGVLDGAPTLGLTVTTTTSPQTVTLQRITPTGGDCVVSWGDGNTTTITDGNTATTTHQYATAGTYQANISAPQLITYLDLRDATIGFGAGEIGALTNLTSLYLYSLANCAAQTGLANLLKLTTLRYENNLTQAQMDSVAAQLYAAFPTRTGINGTIDLLGGGNAAPSGVSPGGAECPPTTGYNTFYELVNDSCGVSSNHWASASLP